MIERSRALAGALLIAIVSGLTGLYAGQAGLVPAGWARYLGLPPASQNAHAPGTNWEQLNQVLRTVESRYIDPIPEEELIKGAVRGLVEATGDKYSVFMDPQEYATFLEHFEPTFGGVGVVVGMQNDFVTVIKPIPGTPGERAGLRTGDRIVAVDGQDVTRMSVDEVAQLIRGPKGTKVRLRISRAPYADTFEVEIERADIRVPHMEGTMLDWAPGIGYIRIEEFNTDVSKEVAAKLADLRSQGMQGLILDLRQNPGGLLDQAEEVASLFLGPGPVVHIVERGGERTTLSSKGSKDFDLPMVVLVDGGSASASEIVAGALKDRGVAVLVGTKTFGKGSVQSFYNLEGGAGLKLTTARYLTAGGHSIHEKGIMPDVEVPVPEPAAGEEPIPLADARHPQMQRAVEILQNRMR